MKNSEVKSVSFVTGAPGVGKTSIMKLLKKNSLANKRNPLVVNDYGFLEELAIKHRHDSRLVTWHPDGNGGEYFLVEPAAYPEVSTMVASTIARNLVVWLDQYQDIAIEFARGARLEGFRDQYDSHGFDLIVPVIAGVARVANFEIVTSDHDEVRRRMDARLVREPKAAPAFVHDKYLDGNGNPLSSVLQAAKYDFVVNEQIDNGGRPDEVISLVASLFQRLISTPSAS